MWPEIPQFLFNQIVSENIDCVNTDFFLLHFIEKIKQLNIYIQFNCLIF